MLFVDKRCTFSDVNENRISILCGKFTRPEDVKNPNGIL